MMDLAGVFNFFGTSTYTGTDCGVTIGIVFVVSEITVVVIIVAFDIDLVLYCMKSTFIGVLTVLVQICIYIYLN